MKNWMKIVCGVLLVSLSFGCVLLKVYGSGVDKTEIRSTETFSAVENRDVIRTVITLGNEYSVVVKGDDNLLQFITTEVIDQVLIISAEGSFTPKSRLEVLISVPQLERIENNGIGDIIVNGDTDELTIKTLDVGDVDARELTARIIHFENGGNGNSYLGLTDTINLYHTGNGNFYYPKGHLLNIMENSGNGEILAY